MTLLLTPLLFLPLLLPPLLGTRAHAAADAVVTDFTEGLAFTTLIDSLVLEARDEVSSSSSSFGDKLSRGGKLRVGQQLFAANKAANLKVQGDGNLVLYQGVGTTKVLWASNTAGKGGAGSRLVLQGDGNLVLYTGGSSVLWATNTASGGRLVVQGDCNLVLYNDDNSVGWATNTASANCHAPGPQPGPTPDPQPKPGPSPPSSSGAAAIFGDVTTSLSHRYNMQDNTGHQLGVVHVDAIKGDKGPWGGHSYIGVYHVHVNNEFEVRLASSPDMMSWTYRRTLVSNADMPYLFRVDAGTDGWLMLTHEQWMTPGSGAPSRLGFKLYYNEAALLAGNHFNSYNAPLTVGHHSSIEGTPCIYAANRRMHHGLVVVDADIGFHFNNKHGIDQVGQGRLESFGPTTLQPSWGGTSRADNYDQLFIDKGAVGNIGQRAPGVIHGTHISLQEANIGPMPPTIWKDWRVWLYYFGSGEGDVPGGAGGAHVEVVPVKTHAGSTAFGNPSWHHVPCPGSGGNCVFVSYFIFGEGAKPGEGGVLGFVKRV